MSDDQTPTTLSVDDIQSRGLDDWRVLAGPLYARFVTGDFARGLEFVGAVGEAADRLDHHPDVDLRYAAVRIRLFSHDAGGRTERDVELAAEISRLAADRGIAADPAALTVVEYGLDTADLSRLAPFWRAVQGIAADDGEEVVDPDGFSPTVWFQPTDPHETPRQRWHPDVWVAPEQAQARVEAAVAAGGTVVSTADPTFTVLADPDGNLVCVCVSTGR